MFIQSPEVYLSGEVDLRKIMQVNLLIAYSFCAVSYYMVSHFNKWIMEFGYGG